MRSYVNGRDKISKYSHTDIVYILFSHKNVIAGFVTIIVEMVYLVLFTFTL